jgi:hypothetical protein
MAPALLKFQSSGARSCFEQVLQPPQHNFAKVPGKGHFTWYKEKATCFRKSISPKHAWHAKR